MTSETAEPPMIDKAPGTHPLATRIIPQGVIDWAVRVRLTRKLSYALIVCAALSGVATYAALTGLTQIGADPTTVFILLNINLVLLLALGIIVVRRVVALWAARRRGSAGSRLHIRLAMLFALVSVLPAIVVAVFSVLFFNLGIQAWFSDRVRTALDESNLVAEAYLKEHQQNIRNDILALATDINREGVVIYANPNLLNQLLATHAVLRSLSEVVVFEGTGKVLAKSGSSFVLEFESAPPEGAFEAARNGEVALMTTDRGDRVRAMVQLNRLKDTFLYVGRFVDHRVLNHMENTQRAVRAYEQLEGRRSGLEITFAMIFMVVALLLMLAAVWVGLFFANRLVRPIGMMIAAAEKVSSGDLTVRVTETTGDDELGTLSRVFNRMTGQLEHQRSELIEANRQLELRRQFTAAVLSGVSAGVVGLDDKGRINLPNRSASELLATDLDKMIGREWAEVVPEMAGLLSQAMKQSNRLVESQVKLARKGRFLTLLVRISAEKSDDEAMGYVVTFDDVSDLLYAQRTAAWADVARRIAHEIKNPLTPIQLSAERLKRKYLKQIDTDAETFITCTDTIIRQVRDIGRMVDEFSSFARMPRPVMEENDLSELCRQAVFLQNNAFPKIEFKFEGPPEGVKTKCDGRLISQSLTNLLKNAAESIEAREKKKGLPPGVVTVTLAEEDDHIAIVVEDNGCGFPEELRENMTDPYVTSRAKGTGLGLAIVKKIMEDHRGALILQDREGGGARIGLILPRSDEAVVSGEERQSPDRLDMRMDSHGK